MAVDVARSYEIDIPLRPRRRRTRGVRKRPLFGGVAWIATATVLLAGIVALNVVVLRLNLKLDDLSSQRTELRAEITQLKAQAANVAVPEIIRTEATQQGYRKANPYRTRYLELKRRAR
jgi:outer membrane murein-binding lipoprotein Lpp